MEIPFVGGAYQSRSKNINAQICQNWYPIIDNHDGSTILALMGTRGTKLFMDTGAEAEARGAIKWKNSIYALNGSTLYKIDAGGTVTNVGTVGTSSGRVYMAGGVTYLCIVDGEKGYYQEQGDTSLTEIDDSDFETPSSICYIDGFFITTIKDSDSFQISASEDPSSWDGLDFASAEEQPDDIILGHAYRRHLICFGAKTIEIFFNTGDQAFPFTRVSGAVINIGLGAKGSVASGPEGLFFLDNLYQVRRGEGYQTQVISTEHIDYEISQYTVKDDAIGWTYTQEGHSFYMLTFPDANETWSYDVITGFWHKRATGLTDNRHPAAWHCWFAGKNVVGHETNGKIYVLDHETFDDDGDYIRSIRHAQIVQSYRKRLLHHKLEIEFESGVGLVTGQGSDPQAMLQFSDDNGSTWSNEKWRSIGKIGKRKKRLIWRRLGRSRKRIYRLVISDPIKRVLLGAHLDARVTNG